MALSIYSEHVMVQSDTVEVEGMLWVPENATGVILFANGSGSNRLKPPGDYVSSVLRNARIGTLWLDLLTRQELDGYQVQPDIPILTQRLHACCDWLREHEATRELPIGLFGVDKGAAAALQLAASRGQGISAIVSRGGRPDLAAHGTLAKVSAPTLLIVPGLDERTTSMNRAAYAALRCKKRMEIIPGATLLFEEPGIPEVVARLARGWFQQNMRASHRV